MIDFLLIKMVLKNLLLNHVHLDSLVEECRVIRCHDLFVLLWQWHRSGHLPQLPICELFLDVIPPLLDSCPCDLGTKKVSLHELALLELYIVFLLF